MTRKKTEKPIRSKLLQETEKIRVIKAFYDPKREVLLWNIERLQSKTEVTLLWTIQDLCNCMHFNFDAFSKFDNNQKQQLLDPFCEQMAGKTITMISDYLYDKHDINFSKDNPQDLKKVAKIYKEFPFTQAIDIEEEKENYGE